MVAAVKKAFWVEEAAALAAAAACFYWLY